MDYKDKYLKLVNSAEDKDTAEFIFQCVDSCRNYVNSVLNMELQIPILKFRCPDESDYRNSVMELDRLRRSAHEHAINCCRALNRYCNAVEIDTLWFEGDLNNRHEVATFCGKVVSSLFNNGIKPTQVVKKIAEEELLSMCK